MPLVGHFAVMLVGSITCSNGWLRDGPPVAGLATRKRKPDENSNLVALLNLAPEIPGYSDAQQQFKTRMESLEAVSDP